MTDDLLTAVDDLTLSKPVKVPTDTGHTWAREEALLVQLQEAVSSSIRSGSGSGGAAWTRNVLDSDALHRASIITSQIGDWCRMAGVIATRDPVKDLRAWYVAFRVQGVSETFYLGQLRKWAGEIRAMMCPPKTLEITSPCPVCNQGTYTNDMGEVVRHPVQLMYRPDAHSIWQGAKAVCRSCAEVWQGESELRGLRWQIDAENSA